MDTLEIAEPPTREPNAILAALSRNILWVLLGGGWLTLFIINPNRTFDATHTGLSTGSIFALDALGYTLVYGIIELINFAHGDVFMLGTFIATGIFEELGVGASTAVPVVIAVILLTLIV